LKTSPSDQALKQFGGRRTLLKCSIQPSPPMGCSFTWPETTATLRDLLDIREFMTLPEAGFAAANDNPLSR
jgi:hypothetical protein